MDQINLLGELDGVTFFVFRFLDDNVFHHFLGPLLNARVEGLFEFLWLIIFFILVFLSWSLLVDVSNILFEVLSSKRVLDSELLNDDVMIVHRNSFTNSCSMLRDLLFHSDL